MRTKEGIKEAEKRTKIIIDFLYQYFEEEEASNWSAYLTNFLETWSQEEK